MSKKPRGPAAPTDTPRKRGRPPSNPDAIRLPSGQYSRGQGIRERGPNARSEHVGCRLTKADAEALEAAAAAAGRKASEWARHLILLGMGVQKLGQEVGADMDGSPESALASIKTRLKAAGKHGLAFDSERDGLRCEARSPEGARCIKELSRMGNGDLIHAGGHTWIRNDQSEELGKHPEIGDQ